MFSYIFVPLKRTFVPLKIFLPHLVCFLAAALKKCIEDKVSGKNAIKGRIDEG